MANQPIAIYTNVEDGLQTQVTTGRYGYHVSLLDLDSAEYLGLIQCFPEFEAADAMAQKAAMIQEAA
ncbi:MAG TPA: hypothetical protein VFM97_00305 [Gammaproteobacteria bacterium]|nr:hypothetical protein [Gammaproteobacteria bacterium]